MFFSHYTSYIMEYMYIFTIAPTLNILAEMNKKYTNDGLHLYGTGYLLWRDIVKPYINE